MPQIAVTDLDASKRRLLTPHNLAELEITEEVLSNILKSDAFKLNTTKNGQFITVAPDGISINETSFGAYSGPTAAALGWMAYFDIGAALVEERADIIQPAADVISTREYQNRSASSARAFVDTIDFSVSNTLSWSLQGTAQLTLEGSLTGELSSQLQKSMQQSVQQMASATSTHTTSDTNTTHNEPNNTGTQQDHTTTDSASMTSQQSVTDTATVTATGTATGSATAMAALMLGITGSVSGSVTTNWNSTSTLSG